MIAAACVAMISCAQKNTVTLFSASDFEDVVDGKNVSLYTLKAGDLTMQVTNFGGRVVSLWTPDKNGSFEDIVLGYNNLETYVNNPGERFLGAVVGPYANRIANGTYTIGEETYNFPQNNNGQTLHGGLLGLDMIVWDVDQVTENAIVLSVVSKEAEGTYGYKITQDVRQVIELSESTLYPVLRRLQKEGCLEVYDKECAGRNRRYYKVTELGNAQLNLYKTEWKIYSNKINFMFEGGDLHE